MYNFRRNKTIRNNKNFKKMKKTFTTNTALIFSILFTLSFFSCQQEKVIPAEKFEKKLEGTWEVGPVIFNSPTESAFFTHFVFDKDGFFKARNGTAIAKSGTYTVSKVESIDEDQILMLVTEDQELVAYYIDEYTGKRFGLIPIQEKHLGNVFYYDKK